MTFKGRGLYTYSSKEPRTRRFGWLFIGACVALVALVASALLAVRLMPTSTENRADTFSDAQRLVVDNATSGAVEITGTDGDEITVERTLEENPLNPAEEETSLDDSEHVESATVRTSAWCSGPLFFSGFGGCSVDYRIGIPEGTETSVRTGPGKVDINSVEGAAPISVSGQAGDVDVRDVRADVSVDLTSGSARLDNVEGDMNLETTSGAIRASGSGESVRAVASSGGITLDGVDATSLETDTTSGSVDISGTFDTADLDTTSGSLELRTTGEFRIIEARSTSGAIDLGVPQGGYDIGGDSTSGDRDIGVERDGDGPRIEATTTSGSLRVTPAG
ncbi:DUF4097 family beta strand repeat-containing protein [Halostreptopolyspora alba]|uniref:DUF4097 domain-containing protein n=1 Tax=Halostreptopolyspora alba TaxID=2487137 RepID=A0A3N0E1A8_9ACTN|nr:hypothetical protein EFW17_22045 [Nocardiopsaceae bacterium YIM 96095]